MGDYWGSDAEAEPIAANRGMLSPTDRSVRKQQITIRLDPEMIVDARAIAARKGIGHHTLLRMWVMEGINRAYEEGLLDGPPRSWAPEARRGQDAPRGQNASRAARPARGLRATPRRSSR
jgi:hypothetical protein